MLIRKFNHSNMLFKTKFTETFSCFILVPNVNQSRPTRDAFEIFRCFGSGRHFRAKKCSSPVSVKVLTARLFGDENPLVMIPSFSPS